MAEREKKKGFLRRIFSPSETVKQREREKEERKKLRYDIKKAIDHSR